MNPLRFVERILLVAFVSAGSLWAQQFGISDTLECHNYPFPQDAIYPHGLMPADRNHLHAQQSYLSWKNNYVTSSGACGFRRVLFNDMNSTYSEGIGYGMLLAANFDDQPLFDDLWRYYVANLDQYGLMHWWIGNNCQVLGINAATDADEDVAFALLLADKQWCSTGPLNYRQLAVTQINRIYQRQVERNTYVLKPGDTWGGSNVTNPSYFAPAYYRAFREATGNAAWDSVITKCYQILNNAAHPTTGLVPDWCQANGLPASGFAYYYYYDATRTPWRIALDYLWFGDERAKAFCEKISSFARNIGSVNIGEGYQIDGSPMGSAHINVFVGPFGAGAMGTGAPFQAFCDSAYEDNVATVPQFVNGNYYNYSLRTLTLFLQTGNFFNPLADPVQIPAIPSLVSPVNGSTTNPTSPVLVWHASARATSYRIQIAADSTFTSLMLDDSTLVDTTRFVTGLSNATSYHWRVKAKNHVGWTEFGASWKFTTVPLPPVAPALHLPANWAAGVAVSPTLSWDSSQNASMYRVQVSSDSLFSSVVVDDSAVAATFLPVGPLNFLTAYYWRVSARNEGGSSPFSEAWRFTTTLPPPLLLMPPDGAVGVSTNPLLSWDSVAGALRYQVLVSRDSSFGIVVLDSVVVGEIECYAAGLENSLQYFWRVRGSNTEAVGVWSDVWRFTTILRLPDQVVLVAPLNAAVIASDSVQFTWRPSGPAVDFYWFEIASDSTFEDSKIDSTLTDTIRVARGLVNHSLYWWRVRSKNEAGWGEFSDVRRFSVLTTSSGTTYAVPQEFELAQNYPNPFNPTTTIRYGLPRNSDVSLFVFNTLGQVVEEMVNDYQQAGYHEVVFRNTRLASGIYYFQLRAGGVILTKKFVLIK
ncbi:MAG: T9SS type A sorting domain-containing protein [Bacteroidetes bacterium]|nr:T9SS type A sorting domain-containing protein [Bacteroidota bacterium]MCW5897418.1 T9SS type A sorting domain-containing protein [Bacteroidota bacterium]